MADKQIYKNLNLNGLQAKNLVVHNVADATALAALTKVDGKLAYQADTDVLYVCANNIWEALATQQYVIDAIAGLAAGLVYKGTVTGNQDLTALATISQGDFYKVSSDSTTGLVTSDGTIMVNTGDMIIFNADVAVPANVVNADVDKIDNTESAGTVHKTVYTVDLSTTGDHVVAARADGYGQDISVTVHNGINDITDGVGITVATGANGDITISNDAAIAAGCKVIVQG
jgi:hypothetical protein